MWVPSLGWEDPLEKGIATHSSIVAWRIPWTEEPEVTKSQTRLKRLSTYACLRSIQKLLRMKKKEGLSVTFQASANGCSTGVTNSDAGVWTLL